MSAPRVAPPSTNGSAGPGTRAQFIALSVQLTGFDRVSLLGTGMADKYLEVLGSAVGAGVLDDLLAAAGDAPDAGTVGAILRDLKLGPVARNLTILWYCGTWAALPGAAPTAPSGVVSAQAYQQGLQWVAAGAHPMGARQQGYGAWAEPPSQVAP